MLTPIPSKPHPFTSADHRVPDEDAEPGTLPVDPDEGVVPPQIPEDPEHDRTVDPAD